MSFRLRTLGEETLKLIVSYDDGKTFGEQKFCGESWCSGSCGLPALVLKVQHNGREVELKTHSNMVAYGPVFQLFRVQWTGEKVFLGPEAGDPKTLTKLMWI